MEWTKRWVNGTTAVTKITDMKWQEAKRTIYSKWNDCCDYQSQKWTDAKKKEWNEWNGVKISQMIWQVWKWGKWNECVREKKVILWSPEHKYQKNLSCWSFLLFLCSYFVLLCSFSDLFVFFLFFLFVFFFLNRFLWFFLTKQKIENSVDQQRKSPKTQTLRISFILFSFEFLYLLFLFFIFLYLFTLFYTYNTYNIVVFLQASDTIQTSTK